MKSLFSLLVTLIAFQAFSQKDSSGIIIGSVMDEKSKALQGATVQLISFEDSLRKTTVTTDEDGSFELTGFPYGFYKIRFSYVGMQTLTLDSIHVRAERFDFNLNDVVLKQSKTADLDEIIIYAEKPLIQSKDGNITFNAGESALSESSNASDLLTNVPLVTKDPSGKLMVRGKEPKVLIDDKPVELNLEQLQDLLESMPGSSIEKIEVMTNPPPQYASEQGGVINIVTRKGAVGMNVRLSVYAGTRGEAGAHASFNYRKQGLSFSINAGAGRNEYLGEGYSKRINTDSARLNTINNYHNTNLRPSLRANINYDINKNHLLNLVLQYNENRFDNQNNIEYKNLNRFNTITRFSERNIVSKGETSSPNISFSYTFKTKRPGETFRLITNYNTSDNETKRDFYEQYFYPDHTPNGRDSTLQQTTNNLTKGSNIRLSYDVPLENKKTVLSLGSYYNISRSDIEANAYYKQKPDGSWANLEALTNHFLFYQYVNNFRGAVKQVFGENFSVTTGLSAEQTRVKFDLFKTTSTQKNSYWNYLPFATLNKTWKDMLNLTFSYRRTLRRPGVNQLNPTIDSSDQFNIRYGNPELKPSLSNNFDLVLGRSKNSFYANIGFGYNTVKDLFSQLRINPTEITWQNISGRKEYELSTWSGFSVNRKMKINLSASYSYNVYSDYDKVNSKFRDGGSFTSNLNTNYTLKDLYTATGSFTFNRFANPQGTVKSSLSMHIGLQARLMNKKLITSFNIIDPFTQQESRSLTYGAKFTQENFSTTQTRSYRLSLAYILSKSQKKKGGSSKKAALRKISNLKN